MMGLFYPPSPTQGDIIITFGLVKYMTTQSVGRLMMWLAFATFHFHTLSKITPPLGLCSLG